MLINLFELIYVICPQTTFHKTQPTRKLQQIKLHKATSFTKLHYNVYVYVAPYALLCFFVLFVFSL